MAKVAAEHNSTSGDILTISPTDISSLPLFMANIFSAKVLPNPLFPMLLKGYLGVIN
ncbi:hypothetical protein ES703_86122 [subsurface metagenome]